MLPSAWGEDEIEWDNFLKDDILFKLLTGKVQDRTLRYERHYADLKHFHETPPLLYFVLDSPRKPGHPAELNSCLYYKFLGSCQSKDESCPSISKAELFFLSTDTPDKTSKGIHFCCHGNETMYTSGIKPL
jgi:hypothetical protein